MFWRFNYMPSRVDSLLDKENVTLLELMDEDDVVQECKSQNKKLVDFLLQSQNMEALVQMIVGPPEDVDEKTRFNVQCLIPRYPNIACELITSDVNEITEMLVSTESLLNSFYTFLESDDDLNPLQASFFSKVMGLLITRRSQMMVDFLKSRGNFVDRLLYHLGVSAIMDVLLRLITCIESIECRNDCVNWLNDERLVPRLVEMIDPSHTPEKHTNAAQSLCDIIRLSREQIISGQDEILSSDALLKTIESCETVSSLLDHMLNGDKVESVIVNGISILHTLLECRKISSEGVPEPMSLLEPDQLTPGMINTTTAVVARLKDFHDLLHNPPQQHYQPMPTTVGLVKVPLGQTRLQIARLIAMMIMTGQQCVIAELANLGTLSVLLELFFEYSWNNFLHAQVEQCITGIVSNSQAVSLLPQLLADFSLLERIAQAFEDNQSQPSEAGQQRQGYMGHLTRIANQLVSSSSSDGIGDSAETASALVLGLSEPARERWNQCVTGSLADINKLNTVEMVGGGTSGLTSSSDDDEEFRSISFPPDDAIQKAFLEYQQQKMTSDFVEQFGFSEEEFAEQEECIGSPFNDRVSRINFDLNTVEDSPTAAAMFEHACSDRIRQFDSTDSDEELWGDKEMAFSHLSDVRHSSAIDQSGGGGDVHTPGRGIDSEGDEYEDEQEILDDSETSDDSDPELASPRFIRQTQLSDESQTSDTPVSEATVISDEVSLDKTDAVNRVGNDTDSPSQSLMSSDSLVSPMEVSSEGICVDQVKIHLASSSLDAELQGSVNMLEVEREQTVDNVVLTKIEPLRTACHLDAAASSATDSLVYSSVPNGPA